MDRLELLKSAVNGLLTLSAIAACIAVMWEGALFAAVNPAGPPLRSEAAETNLFSPTRILFLRLEIPPARMEQLKTDPKKYVKAVLREGDRAFVDVGVHLRSLKRSVGRANTNKPSFTIKFDEWVSRQKFHGIRKIKLENSADDPTFLQQAMAHELFLKAGIPTPGFNFAVVNLNGRDLGLYVMMEDVNRDFLERHFKPVGNLFIGDTNDVSGKLTKELSSNSKGPGRLAALAQAINEPPEQRWQALQNVLAVDRFLTFAALEVALGHTNGYTARRDQYWIYHDAAADRLLFMPAGLIRLFESADGPLFPEMRGQVAKALAALPEGKRAYYERIGHLLDTACAPKAVQDRLSQLVTIIRPILAEREPAAVKPFENGIAELQKRAARRLEFIRQQLTEKNPR